MQYLMQSAILCVILANVFKTLHSICVNTLETVRWSCAAVPCDSVNNTGTHSLMQWMIAVGNTAECCSLFYTLGTQHSNTVVAQQACRSLCDIPPEELAVDATLSAGITSSVHLITLSLWWKSQWSRFGLSWGYLIRSVLRTYSLWLVFGRCAVLNLLLHFLGN